MASEGRVLSIQSHVVHGYVGNKCSVFTLQLLGFDVDPVNSVQFSNHTGYTTFRGTVLEGSELTDLVDGLEANDLLGGYTHMLTGYIGSPSFLNAVIDVYRRLKAVNPGLVYICDPVLGDEGRMYVPAGNVDLYRSRVLPLASMITPNQFEAEVLSGHTIKTEQDAIRVCRILHSKGPDTVVITSSRIQSISGGADRDDDDNIVLFASARHRSHRDYQPRFPSAASATEVPHVPPGSRDNQVGEGEPNSSGGGSEDRDGDGSRHHSHGRGTAAGGHVDRADGGGSGGVIGEGLEATVAEEGDEAFDLYRITFPRLPRQFTGTGDLAAALLLAWTHKLPDNFAGALERVAGSLRAVLARTHSQGSGELVLVQSKGDIEHPPLELRVVPLSSEL